MRRSIAPEFSVPVGDNSAESWADTLNAIGATRLDDVMSFRNHLELLRANGGQ